MPLRHLWKSFASSETVEGSVEATKAVFELAIYYRSSNHR